MGHWMGEDKNWKYNTKDGRCDAGHVLLCSPGERASDQQDGGFGSGFFIKDSKTLEPRADDLHQVQKLEAELQEARGDARQLEEALTEQGRNLREKSVRRPRKFQSLTLRLIVWCFTEWISSFALFQCEFSVVWAAKKAWLFRVYRGLY